MRPRFSRLAASLLALSLGLAAIAADTPARLRVTESGELTLDGKPARLIGVNYYDCLQRVLQDPANTSYEAGFDELAARGIPFARFNAGVYWPAEWKLYRENPDEFFRRFDGVVRAAERTGVGLIPSLFWWSGAVSDFVGEPRNALADPNSKSQAFIKEYSTALYKRYGDSPAIWAWEFGNEYDLEADIGREDTRPPVIPSVGTPESRSEKDDLTADMVVSAVRTFAETMRALDPKRPVLTGNSLPRGASYHLRTGQGWKQDNNEEFQQQLAFFNPDPNNILSVHVYPHDHEKRFNQPLTSYDQILESAMQAARAIKKPLFVGEFGAQDDEKRGGPDVAKAEILECIAAIERNNVPLAAIWVYDFPGQDADLSITGSNQRAFALDAVAMANRRAQLYAAGQYRADIAGGGLRGSLLDFVANAGPSGNGFNPLQSDRYRGENLYRDEATGLYFEHIFNGTAADKALAMFTPNKDIHFVERLSDTSARMVHPAEHSSWGIESAMTYTLVQDGVEMEFAAKPTQARFPLGYAAFMWASYMNHTRERRIHFIGKNGDQAGWMTFGEDLENDFEKGTIRHESVSPLPFEDGAELLNLTEHPTKVFTKPFYYGLVDGDGLATTTDDTMAYIMMFDRAEPMRLALWNFIKNATGQPNPNSPAWDWQFVIQNPQPGTTYGYRAKMLYKPFVDEADVEREYEAWKTSLPAWEPNLPTKSATAAGNVFTAGETVAVAIPADPAITAWRVSDTDGKPVMNGAIDATGPPNVLLGVLDIGWYRLEWLKTDQSVAAATTLAVIVPPSEQLRDDPIAVDAAISWFAPLDTTKQRAFADLARKAGITWIRDRIRWRDMEPVPERFAKLPGNYDYAARIQSDLGLRVLQVWHDVPRWAKLHDESKMSLDLRDVYRFTRAMAKRFDGRVAAWEPWNEGNGGNFGGFTIDEMCAYQKAAYLGFKSNAPELPVCWQPIGGVNTESQSAGILANETWPYFDIYSIHSYDWPESYAELWKPALEASSGRPLWVTECDRGMAPDPNSPMGDFTDDFDRRKSEFIAQSYAMSLATGASKHFHFVLGDYREQNGAVQFGLLRPDLTPRRGYIALAALARMLNGATCLGKLANEEWPNIHAVAFRAKPNGEERDVLVAWAEAPVDWQDRGKQNIPIPWPANIPIEAIYDFQGRSLAIATPTELTPRPIYVVMPSGANAALPIIAPTTRTTSPGVASPIVLQLLDGNSRTTVRNGWTDEQYRTLPGDVPWNGILVIYNFGEQPLRGDIRIISTPGGRTLAPSAYEVSVEPLGRVEIPLVMEINASTPNDSKTLTIKGSFEDGSAPVLSAEFRTP